jgi:DNA repair exonuclease SbcCD ATPase subunit
LDRDIAAERARKWDGQAAMKAAQDALDRASAEERGIVARRQRIARTARIAAYWVEAFGDRGIRSLLFDSVADFLNERIERHLRVLAAGEAAVTVRSTTALKGGGQRERISFGREWSWGAVGTGSAGQDRRVDLAVFMAVQDLAEARSARQSPLKVWDEPGDALDQRGQELFAEWVTREARTRGTGLLITHSPTLEAMVEPDAVWTAVLDAEGSRVEEDTP